MLLSERIENGRLSWIPFGRTENVAVAASESNVRTWRQTVVHAPQRIESELRADCATAPEVDDAAILSCFSPAHSRTIAIVSKHAHTVAPRTR